MLRAFEQACDRFGACVLIGEFVDDPIRRRGFGRGSIGTGFGGFSMSVGPRMTVLPVFVGRSFADGRGVDNRRDRLDLHRFYLSVIRRIGVNTLQ